MARHQYTKPTVQTVQVETASIMAATLELSDQQATGGNAQGDNLAKGYGWVDATDLWAEDE